MAILTAAEAVIGANLGPHVRTGAPRVVERAQTLERANASTLQRHVVGKNIGNINPRSNLVDIVPADQACHALILGRECDVLRVPSIRGLVGEARHLIHNRPFAASIGVGLIPICCKTSIQS